MTPLEPAKSLLSKESEAALGTLEGETPFVSSTVYLFEKGEGETLGRLYLLLSDLARHARNIQKHGKVSLLVSETKPQVSPLERERVTVVGDIERIEEGDEKDLLQENYLKRFPRSAAYLSLPDFHFYRLLPREVHWIGGFGRAQTFKVTG